MRLNQFARLIEATEPKGFMTILAGQVSLKHTINVSLDTPLSAFGNLHENEGIITPILRVVR